MQVQLVDVICDTNFLIHLATDRIKNISTFDTEIGTISFVIPKVVHTELQNLLNDSLKKDKVSATLEFVKNKKIINIDGQFADSEIIEYVKLHGGIVATLDKELKTKIKSHGGSIISLSNNRIVLES